MTRSLRRGGSRLRATLEGRQRRVAAACRGGFRGGGGCVCDFAPHRSAVRPSHLFRLCWARGGSELGSSAGEGHASGGGEEEEREKPEKSSGGRARALGGAGRSATAHSRRHGEGHQPREARREAGRRAPRTGEGKHQGRQKRARGGNSRSFIYIKSRGLDGFRLAIIGRKPA